MYATLFSGLYLPLLAILFGMILRICAIEWRGRSTTPNGEHGPTAASPSGPGYPPLWGVALPALLQASVSADKQIELTFTDVINPYTLLGGLAAGLFAFHGRSS
jgi:cytochrome d ubiquinol oxidase subunit II